MRWLAPKDGGALIGVDDRPTGLAGTTERSSRGAMMTTFGTTRGTEKKIGNFSGPPRIYK
jgi:hypothetical protein